MKPRLLSLLVISLGMFVLFVYLFASPALAKPEATFTVNANSDMVDILPGDGVCETATGNGMCTLRAAIMEANVRLGADTIILPPGTYYLTIPGAGENLCLTGDLDITESLTIQGDPTQSTVISASVVNDRVLDIYSGSVSITGVSIDNGAVMGAGGGIQSQADLILTDVQLSYNQASMTGGGIYSTHPITLTNVLIEYSEADGSGGGIYALSTVEMMGTQILNNTSGDDGGGLHTGAATAHLVDTLFGSNHALDNGGAIFNGGWLVMEGGTISGNDAGNYGGGIHSSSSSFITLTDVYIDQNHAVHIGGGVYTDNGTVFNGQGLTFDHNTVDFNGAGLYMFDTEALLSECVFSSNTASYNGGGISMALGSATIEDTTIISNTAAEEGGGIYNGSQLTLVGVTLSDNEAQTGGGMINYDNASTIENSTISLNRARGNGGGIYDHALLSIYNSTITANTAAASVVFPGGRGGGVYSWEVAAVTRIQNTILAGNHHRQMIDWIPDDCYGELVSGDYNLVQTLTNCTLTGETSHNLTGVDPLLGDLADNGGPTPTRALLVGSPAIDAANPAGCLGAGDVLLTSDQRGVTRPLDGDTDGTAYCDMGAFEVSLYRYSYLPLTVK